MNTLFSIDTSSHLAKLTRHYFSSAGHFSVELVRQAMIRYAKNVWIETNPQWFEIRDDGVPIPDTDMERIVQLSRPGLSSEAAEPLMASFLDGKGIGLLALLTMRPRRIEIDQSGSGSFSWRFEEGAWRKTPPVSLGRGQRIRLVRSRTGTEGEEGLVREYCRFASAYIELNGKILERDREIEDALVFSPLKNHADETDGALWIPRNGKTCRIWLLDHGVIWKHRLMPANRGFIYEAALNIPLDHGPELWKQFQPSLLNLYRWLIEKYPRFARPERERIEELLFLHFEENGGESFLNQFPFLRVLGGSRLLTLAELKQLPEIEAVAAEEEALHQKNSPSPILVLTPEQRDFLKRVAKVPFRMLPAPAGEVRIGRWWKMRECLKKIPRLLVPFRPLRDHARNGIPEREKWFLALLESAVNRLAGAAGFPRVRLFFFHPLLSIALRRYRTGKNLNIGINPKHPMIRRAVSLAAADPRNLEWIAAWMVWG